MKTIITLLLCTLLISCNEKKNVDIVTTIKPIQMLVVAIAGDHLQSKQLIPDGASPHQYALKPSDIRLLHNAKLIFRIDEGLESFLNKSLGQTPPESGKILSLADTAGINLLPLSKQDSHQHGEHAHDLHIWLDPDNAIAIAKIIAVQLSHIDPAHSDEYQSNLSQLVAKIQKIDTELKIKLKPIANKPFLVFHNAWGYFEKHYGLNNVSVINQTPAAILSAAKVKSVREEIKTKKIECLFTEPQFQLAILKTLIKNSNVKVSKLDVLGSTINLTPNSYIELLETTANSFLLCE